MNNNVLNDGLTKLLEKLESWGEGLIKMIPNILIAIIVMFIFIALSRWVHNMMKSIFKRTQFNEGLENIMANICRILVICLGVVFALGILELQKTVFSLLAGVGVIGLALGFAFQDLAANFISGIMLAVRTPLKIGDVIEINDTMGTVIDIRLRDTIVRTFGGQDVFIPNKDFTSHKFTNYSSFGKRRVKIEVGIGYENDPEQAQKIIAEALGEVKNTLTDPAPEAFVGELGASSVNLFGHVWFTYPGSISYYQIQNDAIIIVKKRLEEAGFNIPFPIRTLQIDKKTVQLLKDK
jgi:small conductance mechanosensitive channel